MRLLVTGANGQLGWELARSLMPLGEVIAVDRTNCDLSRPDMLPALVSDIRPQVIVNTAAYTAVDKAEQEEALAMTINGTAVGMLAEAARKVSALLVHYSTDYVFDGKKAEPYTEDDTPNPLNAYGRTKLAGEEAIKQSGCDYLILRTSWIYAARGHNFVRTILRLARERDELNIVADQFGAPTWVRNVADATAHVVRQAEPTRATREFLSGIYNLTASGRTSWYGFAQEIVYNPVPRSLFAAARLPTLVAIPAEAYPLAAVRPKNSRLDGSKLRKRFGLELPAWEQGLSKCLSEIVLMENSGRPIAAPG